MEQKFELLWEIDVASTAFPLYILYSQLCVFVSSLQQPFNDWLQAHVDQGFAWRPGSASFRALVEEGQHLVELEISKQPTEPSGTAIRVIEVPFEVPADGNIEVASISESVPLTLTAGSYILRCAFYEKNESGVFPVRLTFIPSENPKFKVARADNELCVPLELVKEANPAI